MQNLPVLKKAFLATKNVSSNFFLLTERAESKNGDNFLFYIIETTNEKIGQKIQQQIHNNLTKKLLSADYYSLPQLESSLQLLNTSLNNLNIISSTNDAANVIIGFCELNVLHLSMTGNLEGYLIRKGKINSLTDGLGNNEELGFHNITSGELGLQDMVIIGNKSFFDRLSLDRIRKTLNLFTPRLAIKDFFQLLRKSKNFDCNAVVIQASDSKQDTKEDEGHPDILYLDVVEEGRIQRIKKKLSPIINSTAKSISGIASSLSNNSQKVSQKASEKWQNNFGPKAKEILSKTNDKALSSLKSISSNIDRKRSSSENKVKVKSYTKTSTKVSPVLTKILEQLLKFIKIVMQKENRRYFYGALILILIVMSYFKIVSNNKNRDVIKKQNDTIYSIEKAAEVLKSAEEDISLGRSNGLDKLNEALSLANAGLDNPSTHDRAQEIKKDVLAEIDKTTKTKRYYNLSPIFSFKNDISVSAVSGSLIYGLTSDGKIYATDSRDKDPKLLGAIESIYGTPISAFYSDSANLLYVLTNKPTVWAYDPQSQSGAELILADGAKWESGSSISTYSTNIYILDAVAGKIWRHSKGSTNFTAGSAFAGSKNTDAKDGISLAIDGSAYVLKPTGSVLKFSHGAADASFNLASPPVPDTTITKPSQLYTDSDSQNIFISDKSLNRVIRFAKAGEFVNQYVIDGREISNFLVNPRIQKLWIISQKDVFEIDL